MMSSQSLMPAAQPAPKSRPRSCASMNGRTTGARLLLVTLLAGLLAACSLSDTARDPSGAPVAAATASASGAVRVKIIAFNDLHGHLQPPELAITLRTPEGQLPVPAGGAAYLASAIAHLRARNPHHAVVSAGDMVGASPLVSALFLDEPTILAANTFGLDFNAVGNHEFDRGWQELLRLQHGGCERFTRLEPCRVDKPFAGARFGLLAANVRRRDGGTFLPATGIKEFRVGASTIKVGFIGMTLRGTPSIVTPSGVAGLRFADEAATANALVPTLKAQGVSAIVVLLHQGGEVPGAAYNEQRCEGLRGDIVPILRRLDPAIDVVVSGHTHRAYLCDYARIDPARPFLLTSAGQYGTLLTDIDLDIDPLARKVIGRQARQLIVQGEAFTQASGRRVESTDLVPRFTRDAAVDRIVNRYAAAAAPLAERAVGRLAASVTRQPGPGGDSPLGNLIADAQLAATRAPERGGAQLALMNPGGVRADLVVPPGGGPVTYGQLFKSQPFGNTLVVKTFTGAQLKALLERQFHGAYPRVMSPSAGFSYRTDLRRPVGRRVSDMRLHGEPVGPEQVLRVTVNSFLASGGDSFEDFNAGRDALGGDLDVDALEQYIAAHPVLAPPTSGRILRD